MQNLQLNSAFLDSEAEVSAKLTAQFLLSLNFSTFSTFTTEIRIFLHEKTLGPKIQN